MTHYLGIIGDLLDTPDPYILVHINCAAKKSQKTKHFNNEGRDQLFIWVFLTRKRTGSGSEVGPIDQLIPDKSKSNLEPRNEERFIDATMLNFTTNPRILIAIT